MDLEPISMNNGRNVPTRRLPRNLELVGQGPRFRALLLSC